MSEPAWIRMMDAVLEYYTHSKIKYRTIRDVVDVASRNDGLIEMDLQKDVYLGNSKSSRYRNYKILEDAMIIRKVDYCIYEINPLYLRMVLEYSIPKLLWE